MRSDDTEARVFRGPHEQPASVRTTAVTARRLVDAERIHNQLISFRVDVEFAHAGLIGQPHYGKTCLGPVLNPHPLAFEWKSERRAYRASQSRTLSATAGVSPRNFEQSGNAETKSRP